MLLSSRLYLVLDKDSCYQGNVTGIFHRVRKEGIDLVQLRENTASDRALLCDAQIIKRLCQEQEIIFLINNRLDIAWITNADGLHLGQLDLPLKAARKILGKNKILGMSCHNLTQALKAEAEGADYISIGPIFPTQTKPNLKPINPKLIKMIKERIKIPFFVIGGINQVNIRKIISYGAKRFALCRAICCAENVKKASQELRALIDDSKDYPPPLSI